MSQPVADVSLGLSHPFSRIGDYLALTKPRIVAMVLVTTSAGFYLAQGYQREPFVGLKLIVGTALAAAGTLALNQFMERHTDALMVRTRNRPLPDGRIAPVEALLFGSVLMAAGWLELAVAVNWRAALVTVAVSVIYLAMYTPMKYRSPLCTVVGAVSGALPPVAGWAAMGSLNAPTPWLLFGIMFFWQFPHTFAIAQLYKDDFARAGIRFLPVCDEFGHSTARRTIETTMALLVISTLPWVLGVSGMLYLVVAVCSGAAMLVCASRMAAAPAHPSRARHLLFSSLFYLPLVLVALVADKL